MKPIKLISDFRDYYDHHFCSSFHTDVIEYRRMSREGLKRSDMFEFFKSLGLKTPRYGLVKELPEVEAFVIYIDEQAHSGDGKVLVHNRFANIKYYNYFASEFVFGTCSISYRYLCIGKKSFWLKYTSNDLWRSNCGYVEISLLSEEEIPKNININITEYPLYAIDFIYNNKEILAIDFNIAPEIKGTGVDKFLNAKDIYKEIEEHYALRN